MTSRSCTLLLHSKGAAAAQELAAVQAQQEIDIGVVPDWQVRCSPSCPAGPARQPTPVQQPHLPPSPCGLWILLPLAKSAPAMTILAGPVGLLHLAPLHRASDMSATDCVLQAQHLADQLQTTGMGSSPASATAVSTHMYRLFTKQLLLAAMHRAVAGH